MEEEKNSEDMLLSKLAHERERLRRLYAQAQPCEREYLEAVLDHWERRGVVPLDEAPIEQRILLAEDFLRQPVSVGEFIYGANYLGPILKDSIFPPIVEDLEELFDGNYSEVSLGGAIGSGKTTFAVVAVTYNVYRLSCLKDPAVAYGMKRGSNLTFVNFSVNVAQARKVFFQDLYNVITASPYFQNIFPFDRRLKTEIRFPNNIRCYPVAASEQAALGVGVFSACIDEANFMGVVERSRRSVPGATGTYDQAEAVFNKVRQRMRSRLNQRGTLPGLLVVISSARYPNDFTERLEEQARKEAAEGKHYIFVRHYKHWDTRPKSFYMSECFKVEVGDVTRRSRVLNGTETDVNVERVVEVPMDFKRDFDRDPEASVRDFCGISTLSVTPFIVKREMIERMFELGREYGLEHPFTKMDVTLQEIDPDVERLLPAKLHWIEEQATGEGARPLFKDGKPVMKRVLFPALYYAHIDLSKTRDATGLAVGHVVGTKMCSRMRMIGGRFQPVEEKKPIIRIDLVLRIVAPRHGEIDIPRVRGVLYQLKQLGMEFGLITFDTFGSQEGVKTMKEQGFRADEFSLDKTNEGYEALKDALYDERVLCYDVPKLQSELAQLENTGKKIDHPAFAGASKDLADCLAGVVHHCEEGWRKGEAAAGLFHVGIVEHPSELTPNQLYDQAVAKVTEGLALTGAEEDAILFRGLEDVLK